MKLKILKFIFEKFAEPYLIKLSYDLYIKVYGWWEKRKGEKKVEAIKKAKDEKNETEYNSNVDDI